MPSTKNVQAIERTIFLVRKVGTVRQIRQGNVTAKTPSMMAGCLIPFWKTGSGGAPSGLINIYSKIAARTVQSRYSIAIAAHSILDAGAIAFLIVRFFIA